LDAKEVVALFNALLTPLIAVVAVYIAWQQWQTNKHELELELYDRRLRIYEEVRKILSIILLEAEASTEDLLKFRTAVSEADFLCGHEVVAYVDEIYRRGLHLRKWNTQYRDASPGCDHAKVVEEIDKELTWLTDQFEPTKQLFMKYLKLTK
jgi:hypothetical protein